MQMYLKPFCLHFACEYDAEAHSDWNQAINHFIPVHRCTAGTSTVALHSPLLINLSPTIYRVIAVGKEIRLEFTMRPVR